MKTTRTRLNKIPRTILLTALAAGVAFSSRAQIGTGWSSYTSSKVQQKVGSTAFYSNSGGVETFRISDGDKRSEIQLNTHWGSGQRQFQGEVNCKSGSGGSGGASVQQLMHDESPDQDVNQVRIYNTSGGTLKVLQGSQLGTGVYGKYVRLNVIHNAGTHKADTYLNGTRKSSVTVPSGSTFYFKYGICIRPGQTQWRNIHTWSK